MAETPPKCEMDGDIVKPCNALSVHKSWSYVNTTTGKLTRRYFGVAKHAHTKNGMAFNFCPYCGEKTLNQPEK